MKDYAYHYVYRITNVVTGYHYYGSKSCDEHPSENIGKKYKSSSTNKLFIQDQKNNPKDYKYKVVKIFETSREDAIELEVKLHAKFDVKNHPKFINKSNQTSRFSTTNLPHWLVIENCRKGGLKVSDGSEKHIERCKTGGYTSMFKEARKKLDELQKDPLWLKKNFIENENRIKGLQKYKDENMNIIVNQLNSESAIKKKRDTFKLIKHQQGSKNSQYGTCWIYKFKDTSYINKKIDKSELIKYLKEGWVKGRKINSIKR